jgi:hypothetical protein
MFGTAPAKLNAIHASGGLLESMKTQFHRPEAGFVLSVNGAHAITVPATESRWSKVPAAVNVIVAGTAPSDESSDRGADISHGGSADLTMCEASRVAGDP